MPHALEAQSLNSWTTREASSISVKSFFPLFGHLGIYSSVKTAVKRPLFEGSHGSLAAPSRTFPKPCVYILLLSHGLKAFPPPPPAKGGLLVELGVSYP